MARHAVSWTRAAAIAGRDLKSAPGKFAFVVLSVAVGVAALVGVRGFSESFRKTLSTESRGLMGGDLSARLFRLPTDAENLKVAAVLKKYGSEARSTWVVETLSMASLTGNPAPVLVTLKAVDPAEYPYYGKAELSPAMPLGQALEGDSAVVAEEFLIRTNAHVGESLQLGNRSFKITAILTQEPDRMSAGAGMGPRVMISSDALARSGLQAPGSRASRRLLLKLPQSADAVAVRKDVENALPDAQVMSDLDATAAWATQHGGDATRLGINGFCWGGRIAWLYAEHNPRMRAAVDFTQHRHFTWSAGSWPNRRPERGRRSGR